MPQLFYPPHAYVPSGVGLPQAGCLAYFYITGTNTPKDTYSDFAKTFPNANPVVADANGVWPAIYMDSDVNYRVTITTALGVTLPGYPQDDVPGPLITAAEIGAIIYPQTANESAASVTPTNYSYPPGDVRRYGAIPDGATDSSAAIQQAFDCCKNTGVTAVIEGGDFRFDSQLSISTGLNNSTKLNIRQDRDARLISYVTGSVASYDTAGFAILTDGWADSQWDGLSLDYSHGTAGIISRCRFASSVRNVLISPRVVGGASATDRATTTRISWRFTGNESSAGSTGYATYYNKCLGGMFNIGNKLIDCLTGDGSAGTAAPNAQTFIGVQVERFITAFNFNGSDEHYTAGVWADAAAGILIGTASSVTQAAGVATCTLTAHGLVTNDIVYISGASPNAYNGVARITVTGPDAFTYAITNGVAIDGGTTSPATGTITVTHATVVFRGETTYSQLSGNVETGAASIAYFLDSGGSGGNLLNVIGNTAVSSVVEDATAENLILDKQYIDSSARLQLRVAHQTFLDIEADGRIFGTALHNSAGALTGTTNQYIASGTYTPTLTAVTNVAASTPRLIQWTRVGNVVTVGGQLDVDPTSAAATELGISLPIASNLTNTFNVGGTGACAAVAGYSVAILADATNDRASMQWVAVDTANRTLNFSFTYVIL